MNVFFLLFPLMSIIVARLCLSYSYTVSYFNYSNKALKDKRSLILAFALKYNFEKIKRFIYSLNKSKYYGNVIFFTYRITEEFKKKLKVNNINVIELENVYPFYPSNHKIYPISNKSIIKYLHYFNGKKFVTYRYFIYRLFIKYYGNNYKYILLTDVRDVLFQLDPFQWNIKKGVFLVEEHPKRRIKDDIYNMRFIKDYKPNTNLYHSKVINGGTIYGSYPEILYFLFDFLKYICSFHCNANDQGGINSLIRNMKYFNYPIYILNSSHSPVRTLTLWILDNSYCCLPINNVILNEDKSVPHIIHQYDRGVRLNNSYIRYLYLSYLHFY